MTFRNFLVRLFCYCLGIALKETAWLIRVIGSKVSPDARDSSEVARCYPHTGNGGHSWRLSSSQSWSVGFSIQDETMDVARSAPQGAYYHVDVIYSLP